MKKVIAVLTILGLLLAGTLVASAQIGTDSVTHNTSWVFLNLGDTTADVQVDFYDTDGTLKATDTVTVEQSNSYWAPSYAPLDSVGTFNGSIVASSIQPMGSMSNQVAANATSGRNGNATYKGFTAETVAPTMSLPVLMKAFAGVYWTEFSIQSTASSGDITVDVHYYNEDGSEVSGSPVQYTIHAGSPKRVAQADETILSDGWIGSASVSAQDGTTGLAVVVNEFYGTSGNVYNEFYAYEGFAEGTTEVTLPAVYINGFGSFQSSAAVMNMNGPASPANVTWHFYDAMPDAATQGTEVYSFTNVITTSASVYFPAEDYAQTLMDNSAGDDEWVGSVTLESDQPLIAISNELLPTSRWAASYVGFASGEDEICFPVALVNAYGIPANSSFAISDMSGTSGDVNVTVSYTADTAQCPGCTDWSEDMDFSNTTSIYQPDHIPTSALGANDVYVGSVCIAVNTSSKTINGIMNEIIGPSGQDSFTSFNGFAAQ